MGHNPIRTKLHRLCELVADDQVYVTGMESTGIGTKPVLKHWSNYNPKPGLFQQGCGMWLAEPTFVIDRSISKMFEGRVQDMQKSILDLKEAGVLGLPFPRMTVEWTTDHSTHIIVHLTDLNWIDPEGVSIRAGITKHGDTEADECLRDPAFDCLAFVRVIQRDADGEYVVPAASSIFFGYTRRDGEPYVKIAGVSDLQVAGTTSRIDGKAQVEYVTDTVAYAFMCAVLVYHTQGIEQEVVDCGKLNKHRATKREAPIPRHTYIYIGRVYRSEKDDAASERYDERRHPRPHWRRPHVRGVRYGIGRTQIRYHKFPGRIVAWDGKGEEPKIEAKTHIVKMARRKK